MAILTKNIPVRPEPETQAFLQSIGEQLAVLKDVMNRLETLENILHAHLVSSREAACCNTANAERQLARLGKPVKRPKSRK
jgi:hypothetical protein